MEKIEEFLRRFIVATAIVIIGLILILLPYVLFVITNNPWWLCGYVLYSIFAVMLCLD